MASQDKLDSYTLVYRGIHKYNAVYWTNILLMILFLSLMAIAVYLYIEIEAVKILSQDYCAICMENTGAYCFKFGD
jgi:hypothetical protein